MTPPDDRDEVDSSFDDIWSGEEELERGLEEALHEERAKRGFNRDLDRD